MIRCWIPSAHSSGSFFYSRGTDSGFISRRISLLDSVEISIKAKSYRRSYVRSAPGLVILSAMRISRRHAAIAISISILLIFLGAGSTQSKLPSGNKNWKQELIGWRAKHAIDLQKPDGWLSLVGLEWLQ